MRAHKAKQYRVCLPQECHAEFDRLVAVTGQSEAWLAATLLTAALKAVSGAEKIEVPVKLVAGGQTPPKRKAA
mgnify:FL=1